eukprot:Rhum_TRINITY_DN2014_c0_g1::Rhum_TRINITY_DN2014_c0_g1_i1::g.5527::m.5527
MSSAADAHTSDPASTVYLEDFMRSLHNERQDVDGDCATLLARRDALQQQVAAMEAANVGVAEAATDATRELTSLISEQRRLRDAAAAAAALQAAAEQMEEGCAVLARRVAVRTGGMLAATAARVRVLQQREEDRHLADVRAVEAEAAQASAAAATAMTAAEDQLNAAWQDVLRRRDELRTEQQATLLWFKAMQGGGADQYARRW